MHVERGHIRVLVKINVILKANVVKININFTEYREIVMLRVAAGVHSPIHSIFECAFLYELVASNGFIMQANIYAKLSNTSNVYCRELGLGYLLQC